MKKRKKLLRLVFGRTTFVVLFLLIQVGILLMGFAWLEEYMLYFYGASERGNSDLHYQRR